jgi:hypothetical protein
MRRPRITERHSMSCGRNKNYLAPVRCAHSRRKDAERTTQDNPLLVFGSLRSRQFCVRSSKLRVPKEIRMLFHYLENISSCCERVALAGLGQSQPNGARVTVSGDLVHVCFFCPAGSGRSSLRPGLCTATEIPTSYPARMATVNIRRYCLRRYQCPKGRHRRTR